MKHYVFLGLLAALAATAPVSAQTQTWTPASRAANEQQFEQMHAQMDRIRLSERAQALGALSPSHKALLASIVGQLAISTNPDVAGAARRLDAMLLPSEKQGVLNAQESARTQAHALMANMLKAMGATPHQGQTMMTRGPHPEMMTDPGYVLLRIASPSPAMGIFMHP